MSKPRIFISHGLDDRQWTEALVNELRQRSVDVWFDKLQPQTGQDLQEAQEAQKALVHGLKDSDIYALVIGPRSLSNPNLLFELGVAAASDRPVIAIIGSSTPEVLSSFVTKFANIHQVRTDDAATAADELERVAEHIKGKA